MKPHRSRLQNGLIGLGCSGWLLSILLLSGCASSSNLHSQPIQVPVSLQNKEFTFEEVEKKMSGLPYQGVLYTTDRQPADPYTKRPYYTEDRGHLLRLGVASVGIDREDVDWFEVFKDGYRQKRRFGFELSIDSIEELGVLPESHIKQGHIPLPPEVSGQPEQFFTLLNQRIAQNEKQDVVIYVHGYKTLFESAVILTMQFQHFLFYDEAFVSFSWPTTMRGTAYFKDLESANYASRNLRLLIEAISDHTEAKNIHIVGYSAGTRLVVQALHAISLKNHARPEEDWPRVGEVMLMASDMDQDVLMAAIADGMLNKLDQLTLYVSSGDTILNFLRVALINHRLGQMRPDARSDEVALEGVRISKNISVIDVSNVPGSQEASGHAYIRYSSWVSSDFLKILDGETSPKQRGLILEENGAIWGFPETYSQNPLPEPEQP